MQLASFRQEIELMEGKGSSGSIFQKIPLARRKPSQSLQFTSSRRLVLAFILGFLGTCLVALTLGLGISLLPDVGIETPAFVEAIFEGEEKDVYLEDRTFSTLPVTEETDTSFGNSGIVWNCGGVYTQQPVSGAICIEVDAEELRDEQGTRYFINRSQGL